MIRAFRDTWKDGVHSYLSYLPDRLTIARDLLADSGSIFVQIGDENVHLVRDVLAEIFGFDNFVALIAFKKTGGQSSSMIASVTDYIIWFSKEYPKAAAKYRQLYFDKQPGDEGATNYTWIEEPTGRRRALTASEKTGSVPIPRGSRIMQPYPMFSDGPSQRDAPFDWRGSKIPTFSERALENSRSWPTTTQ
jgi:adenine-specific DNA-methyltransferase